jgi:Zn-dependent protease
VFLPGLGAYVRWYSMGVPLDGLAGIALAGPLFGLAAATLCAGLFLWTRQQVFLALAHTGAFINLLNLIPVLGLDGAQATYALSKLQRGLLLASTIVLFAVMHEGVFLFLAAGMAWRLFTKDAPEQGYSRTMVYFLLLLFSLGAFLAIVPQGTSVRGRAF